MSFKIIKVVILVIQSIVSIKLRGGFLLEMVHDLTCGHVDDNSVQEEREAHV